VPSTQPITSKVTVPLPGSQTLASLRVAQFSPSPSALFRVRPTSVLIFRLVVSANCVFGLQGVYNSSQGPSPSTKYLQPPGEHIRHPPRSIPSATHSRISVVTLVPLDSGVTPLYPHRTYGRSTRASPHLVSVKHIESGLSPLSPLSRTLSQSLGLGFRTPVAL